MHFSFISNTPNSNLRLGFGAPNITTGGPNNAMCDYNTAAQIESETENTFILRIDPSDPITAEKIIQWSHISALDDVGYICEQEGECVSIHHNT